MLRRHRYSGLMLLVCAALALTCYIQPSTTQAAPVSAPASAPTQQSNCQTFPKTGFTVCGRLLDFWNANGGLAVFGYPIGPQTRMTIGAWTGQGQWFERNRLELHPENARPYDVLLGQLGTQARGGVDAAAAPDEGVEVGYCRYFPETGHNLCSGDGSDGNPDFYGYWHAHGIEMDGQEGISEAEALALWGYPITEVIQEVDAEGKLRWTQYFERAVFRQFPENRHPYSIQGDLLGRRLQNN